MRRVGLTLAGLLLILAVAYSLSGSNGSGKASFVLAASWQPAFCETRPDKAECRSQTKKRFDASHFALHGLWPQPRGNYYCGVSAAEKSTDKANRWNDLPVLKISADVRNALNRVMPGTRSNLHRHEWTKHGSCYPGASAEAYFRASILLMEQLNASRVQTLFSGNVGKTLEAGQIRAAFDADFAAGAGQRVRLVCATDGRRRIITELRINLRGEIADDTEIEDLFVNAAIADEGCSSGEIDPVGLQ